MPENGYRAVDRSLIDSVGRGVYRRAIEGGLRFGDAVFEGDEERRARDLLLEMGLLDLDEETGALTAVDPAAVQAQVVAPLSQRGAELMEESAQWADSLGALARSYRQSSARQLSATFELRGAQRITDFIQTEVADCRHELLTAQPHGRRPERVLGEPLRRALLILERGVRMRTLYQHAARHSPPTREYVAQVTAQGAEVRTLDEFFKRLIVIDRRLAIIPGDRGDEMALAIRERSLVAYLVDIFERSWERALPFTDNEVQTARDIAADTRRMTIRMLVEGHSDPASAKRLGVSTRTYAGYIASLKDEYGVQTRFQLGYAMGRNDRVDTLEDGLPDATDF